MSESIDRKVRYVLAARRRGSTRDHPCHWPGCEVQVAPAQWGCRAHWFKLPKRIRDQIWAAYRTGQEQTLTPSRAYVAAAREAQRWIAEQGEDGR